MKFIKGNEYLCIEDFIMSDGKKAYTKGKIYKSEANNDLTDNINDIWHGMGNEKINSKHFVISKTTPEYYNNENGSIYALQVTRNWNSYTFDIVKRLERAEHKGEFLSDIDKCIKTLELYKKEQGHRFEGQFEKLNKNE